MTMGARKTVPPLVAVSVLFLFHAELACLTGGFGWCRWVTATLHPCEFSGLWFTVDCAHTLLELELLDTLLVGGDGGALDADRVLLDGLCSIERDLVVGLVAVRQAQVVVLEVDVEVWVDEAVLDLLPDDAGHLVAVQLDDGVLDLDLLDAGGRHPALVCKVEAAGCHNGCVERESGACGGVSQGRGRSRSLVEG